MTTAEIFNEIREVNLAYLMLAQQLIRLDRDVALFRLGISEEIADILERLTPGQVLKLVSGNTLLCRFRFDDRMLLDLLTSHERERATAATHAAILATSRPVEAIA